MLSWEDSSWASRCQCPHTTSPWNDLLLSLSGNFFCSLRRAAQAGLEESEWRSWPPTSLKTPFPAALLGSGHHCRAMLRRAAWVTQSFDWKWGLHPLKFSLPHQALSSTLREVKQLTVQLASQLIKSCCSGGWAAVVRENTEERGFSYIKVPPPTATASEDSFLW